MKKKITYKNFVAWVNSLPKNKRFNYVEIHNCVFASFLKSLGAEHVTVGGASYRIGYYTNNPNEQIPHKIQLILDSTVIQRSLDKNYNLWITRKQLTKAIYSK